MSQGEKSLRQRFPVEIEILRGSFDEDDMREIVQLEIDAQLMFLRRDMEAWADALTSEAP